MRAGTAVFVAVVAFAAPAAAAEASLPSAVLGFFSWGDPTPPALARALSAFEAGRRFETLSAAAETLEDAAEPFADEAMLVRALVLSDLGWNDLAVPALEALLEAEPVTPYFPLALLALVEVHEREGRPEAVAAAWGRWIEKAWHEESPRARRMRALLEAYGELRRGGERPTREESELLEKPSWLAALRARSRERTTERLLYRAGLALYRLGRHRDSLSALGRIAWTSPYHPYALYTTAQALHAGGDDERAIAAVRLLRSLPPVGAEAAALAGRAAILHAQLLFEAGRLDEAIREAGDVGGEELHASQARLLRGDLCLESERPGLAVTYYRELAGRSLVPRLEAGRGLGLGAAFAALGDFVAASEALEASVARLGEARAGAREEKALAALEALALADARRSAEDASAERRRLAEGMRRIASLEGPMRLGTIVRTIFMSHRSTVLGAPVHDVEALASGAPVRRRPALSAEPVWLDYLRSPERVETGLALARRLALEEAPPDEAERLAADVLQPPAERSEWRRRLVAGEPSGVPAAREDALRAAEESARGSLRRFLRGRDDGLRRLELDLQTALSDALAQRAAPRPPTGG